MHDFYYSDCTGACVMMAAGIEEKVRKKVEAISSKSTDEATAAYESIYLGEDDMDMEDKQDDSFLSPIDVRIDGQTVPVHEWLGTERDDVIVCFISAGT